MTFLLQLPDPSFDLEEFKIQMSGYDIMNLDVAEAHVKVMTNHITVLEMNNPMEQYPLPVHRIAQKKYIGHKREK